MARHPASQELAAFFDGEGDRETSAHVEGCTRCKAKVDELRRLRAHIRSAPLPDPLEPAPPQLTSVATAGRPSRTAGAPNPAGAGPLIVIAVIVLVVLLLLVLL